MSPQEIAAIKQTLMTPGWALIIQNARHVIEKAEKAAMANNDESQFIALYRQARAARDAFNSFYLRLEELECTGPQDYQEAEF